MAEDVSKLPKWAQRRIEILEMRVAEMRESLAEGPPSDTIIVGFSEPDRPLGMSPLIRFRLDDHPTDDSYLRGRWIECRIKGKPGERYLDVRCGQGMEFQPSSGNSAKIRDGAWW